MKIQAQANKSRQYTARRAEVEELERRLPMERLLSLLGSSCNGKQWHCPCPGNHKNGDAHPSVTIKDDRATCWSQRCFTHANIFTVIGVVKGLHKFPEKVKAVRELTGYASRNPNPRPPTARPIPHRGIPEALAFRFELAALDRRLRAERIREASQQLNADGLTESDLDRAMSLVARAYTDQEHATFLEEVADHLRVHKPAGRAQ